LPRSKFHKKRGYSLAAWIAAFSVIVAAVLLVRVPIKNALQAKTVQVTDYMLWKKWGQDTRQHKGDDTSFTKTINAQNLNTRQTERKGLISNEANSVTTEKSASSGVEEGSQAVLKTINLNEIQP
jgi:hypothetical protein